MVSFHGYVKLPEGILYIYEYVYVDVYIMYHVHMCIHIYIYTYNHPKVDRTWDFQPTFPFFNCLGSWLGNDVIPQVGLLAGTLCGASAQHHAAGDGLPVARADLPRQLRDAEERLGWTGGAGGWMGKFQQLGQFFRKNHLKIIFFGEIIWKQIQMFLFLGNMGWGGKP